MWSGGRCFRQLPSSSAGYRELTYPHISPVRRRQCMWEGFRRPTPGADTHLKSKSPSLIIPILDSVIPRHRPWASVALHLLIYRRQCLWESDGGWGPNFLSQYLPQIGAPIAAYPNFSFRHLPSSSVRFRGHPRRGLWATISSYFVGAQTTMYLGGAPEAKGPEPIFI